MAVQPGLCRTWSETPKTGFLTSRLIWNRVFLPVYHSFIPFNLCCYMYETRYRDRPQACKGLSLIDMIWAATSENRSSGFPTSVRHKPGLYNHRIELEAWNFEFRRLRDCTIRVAKTKALISFAVTAKLDLRLCFRICKIRFSHVAAHFMDTHVAWKFQLPWPIIRVCLNETWTRTIVTTC